MRSAAVVLAAFLVLGSGLSVGASARGAYGGGGHGFRGNHSSSRPRDISRDGYGGDGNDARGFRGGFRGDGGRDVWGHRGAYYGPMVSTIMCCGS